MGYCCKQFAAAMEAERSPQFHHAEDGTWDIFGCCGHCYVVEGMKFCPYCGAELKKESS